MMRGEHHLKSWSCTQKRVTLSSGEAELGACVKAAAEAKGMLEMVQSWGRVAKAEVMVDSSAALGVVGRRGSGKLRHIRVGQLWVQEAAEEEELSFKKIDGALNPADACTKHLTQNKIDQMMANINLQVRDGRAEEGLDVN